MAVFTVCTNFGSNDAESIHQSQDTNTLGETYYNIYIHVAKYTHNVAFISQKSL